MDKLTNKQGNSGSPGIFEVRANTEPGGKVTYNICQGRVACSVLASSDRKRQRVLGEAIVMHWTNNDCSDSLGRGFKMLGCTVNKPYEFLCENNLALPCLGWLKMMIDRK